MTLCLADRALLGLNEMLDCITERVALMSGGILAPIRPMFTARASLLNLRARLPQATSSSCSRQR